MKKNNRKGFTITELVIVIAVIAILAAVLIPTFAGVTEKARNSAALQEARNTYTEYLALVNAQPADKVYVQGGDKYFLFEDGQLDDANDPIETDPTDGVVVYLENNAVVIKCSVDLDAHTDCDVCNGEHNYVAPNNAAEPNENNG